MQFQLMPSQAVGIGEGLVASRCRTRKWSGCLILVTPRVAQELLFSTEALATAFLVAHEIGFSMTLDVPMVTAAVRKGCCANLALPENHLSSRASRKR